MDQGSNGKEVESTFVGAEIEVGHDLVGKGSTGQNVWVENLFFATGTVDAGQQVVTPELQ